MDALPVIRPTSGNLPPSAFNECIGDYALLEDFGPHRRLSILIRVENTNRRYITGLRITRPSGSSLSRKRSFAPIGPGTVPVETVKVSYTTQSRFGSFTYKRFTVPQEVHRSAKRVSLFALSVRLKKPFSFGLQRRPGRTSPPPPEAETVRPLMSCELPQCSHLLLGIDNDSPLG